VQLVTVGHGTLGQAELLELVVGAGIEHVVDVRRFPGSRRHPHFSRDAMAVWLPEGGVTYSWEERLGGRRHGDPESANTGLRNAAFRAYADYMATPGFAAALDELCERAAGRHVAVMCAESLWWRCHRRLVADAAVLTRELGVSHLMHDGRPAPHAVTDGATVRHGVVTYPGDAAQQSLLGTIDGK
jgi:uncharacterized protein (DUF488 family)